MRYWVQFLVPSADASTPGALVDALGSEGVYILDGRNSEATMHIDALRRAQRWEHFKRFAAYQLVKGPRLFEEQKRSPVRLLSYPVRVG